MQTQILHNCSACPRSDVTFLKIVNGSNFESVLGFQKEKELEVFVEGRVVIIIKC